MFTITMCHGEVKTVKDKLIYAERTSITEETNVT